MKKLKPLIWLATAALSALTLAQPVISAKSAIAMDAETGKILWSKDPDASRFPASTTKIMTAMLLIERCLPDEIIVAPKDIDKVTDASMHLKPGEKITVRDMVYALLLRSANDGCVAVADHISGSVEKFADLMNQRAKELGCTNTHFNNPNGLNDPKHTISAHDLAIIARAAMKYDLFAQAVRTQKYKITRDPKLSKDTLMVNHDKYLMKDPTADGIKTGWTIPAGRCFVGSATRDGYRVITVVLKSANWQADHKALLDWAFATHDREPVFKADQTFGPLNVSGGLAQQVALKPAVMPMHVKMKGTAGSIQCKFDHPNVVQAPIKAGQKLGEVTVTDEDGFAQTVDLVAAQDVASAPSLVARATGGASPSFVLFSGCLGFGAVYMRRKSRRRLKLYGKTAPARSRI